MALRGTKPIVKVNVECPHCGFEQLESLSAQSTICRNCSNHFEISPKGGEAGRSTPAPGAFLTNIVKPAKKSQASDVQRTVACFDCHTTHKVSSLAKTTLCPNCGSYVDLQDFDITGLFSRSIRTRGRLLVSPRGDLNCGKAICGSAVIEGRIRGSLICEGKAVLKCRGKLSGEIEANHLVVERGAEVEFVRPVRAGRVEIMGKATGKIYCGTEIYIFKKGILSGSVHAKSFVIDQGGSFVGDAEIRPVSQWAEGFKFQHSESSQRSESAMQTAPALGY